jgi:GNAT superfamily N-acetyltransferase
VASAARVELFDTPEGAWFDTWLLLAATSSPAVYALIRAGNEGVACARATLSGGVVGLYDLRVATDHRRQGMAIDLARSRLWWAQAFLQVMENNAAARALQVRLGFVEVYRYWYRLQS